VPYEFASNTLKERMIKRDVLNGFVLDGYPRTIEHLDIYNPNPEIVIYINVPTDMCIQRLLVRGRADDNEKSIERRLGWFFQNAEKVLHYYADQKKLFVVDGTGEIPQTFRQIEAIVLR
jgi:adenylate kinase